MTTAKRTCPTCDGAGCTRHAFDCDDCQGRGWLWTWQSTYDEDCDDRDDYIEEHEE